MRNKFSMTSQATQAKAGIGTSIVLEPARMNAAADGVEPFFWPLPWSDFLAARDVMLHGLAEVLRPGIAAGSARHEPLAAVIVQFIQEVVRAYYLTAVRRRFSEASLSIETSNPALNAAGFTPRDIGTDRIAFLKTRFSGSLLRSLFRPIYGLRSRDNMSWGYPSFIDMKTAIVATNNSALMQTRAKECGERVHLVSMRYWFGDLANDLNRKGVKPQKAGIEIEAMIEAIRRAFVAGGEALPVDVETYLRSWLEETSAIAGFYIEGLLTRRQRLPLNLWTGSAGYIFRRILYYAVRRNGGFVTSHDHGSGLGYLSLVDPNVTEFITTDRFITFTKQQAQSYKSILRDEFRIRPQWPEIIAHDGAPPPAEGTRVLPSAAPRENGTPARIMYIASQYRGEFLGLTPIEFDIVAVDWQARLFAHLREMGHVVFNKAHPTSPYRHPDSFETKLGVQSILSPFETVIDKADLFLFNSADTSAFRPAVLSGKPIVLIEFGVPTWNSEALALAAKRCAIVQGYFDGAGKAQVDWAELKTAISTAEELKHDTSFAEAYFG
jgi:hypothetical protein